MQTLLNVTNRPFYAHTLVGQPSSEWEQLSTHLREVAELAASYADAFGAREWGEYLGSCHDFGKMSAEFQAYLSKADGSDAGVEESQARRVDHSTFGARWASEQVAKHRGQILAYCIAGHHAGLPDGASDDESTQRATLKHRLDAELHRIPLVDRDVIAIETPLLQLPRPADAKEKSEVVAFRVSFFTRMLFACLIDADRTATEHFCDRGKARERAHLKPSLSDLRIALHAALLIKQNEAAPTEVNLGRARVLSECREAANLTQGFFSLNVPTGGGKTLSSLAFALAHAERWGLERVIVAIPFTSIIEQTADTYRKALGVHAEFGLIEHHSNILPTLETRANQLGAETWDAPLIVTTNVQLFESLFAAATSPCRKLHRLARSVIVLDEAQMIPVQLLKPALAALKELVANYGCSIVLCTATQPALEQRADFTLGLRDVRPIIADTCSLFHALKRVEVHSVGQLSNQQVAQLLAKEAAVLCIVNTKKDASSTFAQLIELSGPEGCYHLSTWMCGAHRMRVLEEIRVRLTAHKTCRVVSTQLIEAGVDIDFPVVYRASAGFDSIAQAAGRCNREGKLPLGHTYVFEGESLPPAGLLRDAAQTAKELIGRYTDPIAPEAIEAYFRLYYWVQQDQWDKHEVMPMLQPDLHVPFLNFRFREAASRFKMIPDVQKSILIPYDDKSREYLTALNRKSVDYIPQRQLQPYLVSVHPSLLRALAESGLVMEHESGVWLLLSEDAYSQTKGLAPEACGGDAARLAFKEV